MTSEGDDDVQPMILNICRRCRAGEGGECHTPGCNLWLNRAPDIPLESDLTRQERIEAGAVELEVPTQGRRAVDVAECVLIAAGCITPEP